MKETILEFIKDQRYKPSTAIELAAKLGITKDTLSSFHDELSHLEKEGLIVKSKQDKYGTPTMFGYFQGRIRINKKGFGFVETSEDEEDIYIGVDDLLGAMNNDIVLVSIKKKGIGKQEGRVQKIVERANQKIVGEYFIKKGIAQIKSDDARILNRIIVKSMFPGVVEGHKVVAHICEYLSDATIVVEIDSILGHKNDPGVDILSIVESYGIDTQFNEDTLKELAHIDTKVTSKDAIGRVDLRDELIMTIDGITAKDLDDAIHIKKIDTGFEIGVHIADVTHYVKEGSAIDLEAYQRGTSVYLADRVIPMLPHVLSNGICSLNPNEDRLTISCVFHLNEQGDITEHQLFPSIIHSKYRMTYEKVNQMIENDKTSLKEYPELIDTVNHLIAVRDILETMRSKRGAIQFDIPEAKVEVDKNGKAIDVVLRDRGESERIIESLMICANEVVAEHIHWMGLPFIYRVHEQPKVKRLRQFASVAQILGYKFKRKVDSVKPRDIQQLLDKAMGTKEEALISSLLLRSMQRARYSHESLGHYGLASTYYTHFTSPIRRYPDLMVHRLLRAYLFSGELSNQTVTHYEAKMEEIATETSTAEFKATNCERDVLDMKKAEYMSQFINQNFKGVISSVQGFGMFVSLPNTVEGLVHVSSMRDDHYIYNEREMSFYGRRTRQTYRIGDEVKVKLKKVDKNEGTIDFELLANKTKKHTMKKNNDKKRR